MLEKRVSSFPKLHIRNPKDQIRMMKNISDPQPQRSTQNDEEYLKVVNGGISMMYSSYGCASSEPLKEHEIIDYVTNGLEVEYNNFVTNLFF